MSAGSFAGPTAGRTGWRAVVWWSGWPFRALILMVFRGYQRLVSPLTPASCRLYPCCSEYGVRSVRRHGAAKGTALTAARLVRCNPWNKGGVDLVPLPGRWRSPVDPDGTARVRPD